MEISIGSDYEGRGEIGNAFDVTGKRDVEDARRIAPDPFNLESQEQFVRGLIADFSVKKPFIAWIAADGVILESQAIPNIQIGVKRKRPKRTAQLSDEVKIPLPFANWDNPILVLEFSCGNFDP